MFFWQPEADQSVWENEKQPICKERKMKKHLHLLFEKGQVVPLVVIMIFAIVAMVALIVDGSYIMYDRRIAQNAADAGALAGARKMCMNAPESEVKNTASTYALQNRASSASSNINDEILTVTTSVSNSSFFAKLLKKSTLSSNADASAGCFYPTKAKATLPIAFDCFVPPVGEEGDWDNQACELKNWDYNALMAKLNAGDTQPYQYGYIVMDNGKTCNNYDDSNTWACSNVTSSVGGNLGWLNLTGVGNNGAGNLENWVQNGLSDSDPPLLQHTWLSGIDGNKTKKGYQSIQNLGLPHLVLIPMFNEFCDGNPATDCTSLVHPQDVFRLGNDTKATYHIIGFADFVVTCVSINSNNCPIQKKLTSAQQKDAKFSVEGYFVTGAPIDPDTTGTGGTNLNVFIVSLTD